MKNTIKNTIKKFSKILLFSILLFSSQARALETEWQDSSAKKEGSMSLIVGGYEYSKKITSGIHIKFTDNWKTYWKHPGDSGLAIEPDFSKSVNIKNSEMLWPVPMRHMFFDLEGWGYDHEVILPVISEVVDNTKPAKLVADVKWAICDENCIFVNNKLELEIPAAYKDVDALELINKYKDQVPVANSPDIENVAVTADEKSIVFEFDSKEKFSEDVDLFIIEESKNFRFPKPVSIFTKDGRHFVIKTNYEVLKKGETLLGKTIGLTLRDGKKGFETEHNIESFTPITITDNSAESKPEGGTSNISEPRITLLEAIIAAIIGGLILNIMPCVLPVIMLKIFGVIKHGKSDRKFIRKSFSYTVAGIISSFLLIALFIVVLKSFGHTIGWGIQFQQPAFLVFLSVLLTLFAANQFGWFEISLHSKLADKIHDKLDHAGDATPLGNFLTGAFATLLATPCTAPYLVTAISFAFAAKAVTIFLIFFFMGVGLALPYILIMISPALIKIFPKPGRWMGFVKVILGILLFITNFWIFWIFFTNGGMNAGFMLFVCSLLMTLWLFVAHRMKLDKTKTFFTVIWMVFCTFAITLYLSKIEREPDFMKGEWVEFNRSEINNYINNGKVVFVDVTAQWCLTCKFNEANVIYPMKPYFDEHKVVMMKADYTSPSKQVSDYLEEYHAYGIPLNIIYGPSAKDGIKLPVILKEDDLKSAVERAK